MFRESFLYELSNKKFLSEIIQVDLSVLKNLEDLLETEKWKPYKLENKKRDLYNPTVQHKRALKRLVRSLYSITYPTYLYGGIKNKSYIDNAAIHKNNKYFLIADIEKFFPSTHESYVYDFFRNKMQMSIDISRILTLLVTYQHEEDSYRYLPQGFPTSPLLSFLAYSDMFKELEQFAETNNLVFSAYYDDLTFSSASFISKHLKRELALILRRYGFNLSTEKTRFQKRKANNITGVIVTKDGLKSPYKLTKKLMRLSSDLDNNLKNSSLTKEEIIVQLRRIRGCIIAIQSVDPSRNLQVYEKQINEVKRVHDVTFS
ncbi:reverse transcriptase family protein [Sporosarcina pasteurii]|uniref:RNA-directed DNA polymerase n=1 Tax=Sporosarcina pasteurii TaxID=1474 RepID=A0A380BHG6_SPOPA|nr:reverse transcriptase family protein [Sporosarcina pasteurii]MDS9470696.1 reverse transcriptase family protein [Sporosarcina pasteurii]SUJ01640.1 Retron-type reverse transcriptase [Sporosarcina pasteurii]